MINRLSSRAVRATVMGLVVVGLGACSAFTDILDVQNPDELNEDLLQDEALVGVLVSSVKGDFDDAYDDPWTWRGSMFTDESLTGINWEGTARLNERRVEFDEGDADGMFSELSRARAQGDSVSVRLQTLLETPNSDERMAKVLAYAGYSYVIMADAMCEASINGGATIYTPADLYQFAVDRFTSALTVATAAGSQDYMDLANVGLSRANLNLGNYGSVAGPAGAVTPGFMWYADYTDTNNSVYNVLEARVNGTNHSLGVHPHLLPGSPQDIDDTNPDLTAFITDPRVQYRPTWRLGHNQLTPLYTPYASMMMSNWDGSLTVAAGDTPEEFERGSRIAFASDLEAQHNMHEATLASGGAEAAPLAFVNARQTVGAQTLTTPTGQALIDELREQRGRDFFMAGYRLGDLRRWLRLEGDDIFPSGAHVNSQWGNYGTATCFPMPLEEYEGNENLSIPTN
jgi:hypothetical protein